MMSVSSSLCSALIRSAKFSVFSDVVKYAYVTITIYDATGLPILGRMSSSSMAGFKVSMFRIIGE